jgi:hypothetical protein
MSVCKDQDTFNDAVKKALDNFVEEEQPRLTKSSLTMIIIYSMTVLLFLVWAIYLVRYEKKSDERTLHFLYAIILSPIYVLSYYLNEIF